MGKTPKPRGSVFLRVIGILAIAAMFGGLWLWESTDFFGNGEVRVDRVSRTVTRNGVEYFPRQDITVVMVLGTDQYGPVEASIGYTNESRCDAVELVILDHTAQNYTILTLNRDTMVTMPALGLGGKQAGTLYGQLALSHAFGDGLEQSCENTRKTVSDLLYGITIDHYVALNLEGIVVVNDAVGGVTVNVKDDFSAIDPTIQKGEQTLQGRQALHYVQSRLKVGNELNLSRMERQEEYMLGLMKAFREKSGESESFLLGLYEQIDPYMVTDCSASVISGLLSRCGDYPLEEIVTPKGRNIRGETYYEFYLDESKLDDLILGLFYAKKPN